MEWGEIVKFFAALFAIMNPIGGIPVFLTVTDGKSDAERFRIALVASVAVAAILIACVLIGAELLRAFGISVAGLRTAGGLIILSIAYSLLHAKPSGMHQSPDDATAQDNPAIYPLAMPMIAGPGAISTVIVFAHGAGGASSYAVLIGVIMLMAVLIFLGMRMSILASRILGTAGMNVITRMMGIILAAIAVEMVFDGARGLLQG
ncbi:MAG: MarC family protein [Betaproteobacteria bacterium]